MRGGPVPAAGGGLADGAGPEPSPGAAQAPNLRLPPARRQEQGLPLFEGNGRKKKY